MSEDNGKQRRRKRNSIPKRSDMAAYATDEYLTNKKQERKIENDHTVFRQDKKTTIDMSDRYSNKSSSSTLDGESRYKIYGKESLKPIYDKESIVHDNSEPHRSDVAGRYTKNSEVHDQSYAARNEHIVREEKRTFGSQEPAARLNNDSSSPQPHMYQDRNPIHFSARYDESKITLTKKEQENFKRCANSALISATGYDEKSGRMDIEAYGALRRANGNNSFVEGVKLVESGERSFGDLCTTANRHTITLTPQEKKYYDNVFAQKQDIFRNTGYDQVNGTISLDAYAGIRNSGGNFKNGVDLVNEGVVTFSRPAMEESLRSSLRSNPVTNGERIILSPSERETFEKNISDTSVIYKQCSYDPSSRTMDTGAYSALKNAGGAGGFSGAVSQISEKRDLPLKITDHERVRLTPTENYFFKSIN